MPLSRTVVFALDESKFSEHALKWSIHNYLHNQDTVILLNVRHRFAAVDTAAAEKDEALAKELEKLEAARLNQSNLLLQHYSKLMDASKFAHKTVSLPCNKNGSIKDTICEYTEQVKANVLIVASHGMNVTSRMTLGSVSEYCLRHVPCPVLIVRPTAAQLKTMGIVQYFGENDPVHIMVGLGLRASMSKVLDFRFRWPFRNGTNSGGNFANNMRTLFSFRKQYAQYAEYHDNAVNQGIHTIFVPLLVFTAMVMINSASTPFGAWPLDKLNIPLNTSSALWCVYAAYYVVLHPVLGGSAAAALFACLWVSNVVVAHAHELTGV
ncbi:hypothetical protein HDU81_004905 [Chytriomyces hyalinus]|nr:hypothetical protein HDU81_004905 [Chytriomyces hyalinus]